MKFIPYLNFEGNGEEAFIYYLGVFKGINKGIMRYREMPDTPVPVGYENKVLHGEIQVGDMSLYISDVFPNQTVKKGDQVALNVAFDSLEEMERVYAVMTEGIEVAMPIHDAFWHARFASFVDKYGVSWSMNYQYPEEG